MIRAFLAVELPDALRQDLAALQATLRESGADVKWVEPANLHVTLKFFGEIDDTRIPSLSAALEPVLRPIVPFPIRFGGLGAFPSSASPRVIWVGISSGVEALVALARAVEGACASCGFPPDTHPFAAHLTIGHVRAPKHLATLSHRIQTTRFQDDRQVAVTQVTLFRSILSASGPTYLPLGTMTLEGKAAE